MEERILRVASLVTTVQLDIVDGKFAANRSLDFDFTLPGIACSFEAHLMIKDPKTWIEQHADKVDTILVHLEVCDQPKEIITLVRDKEKKIGFALNPETPAGAVRDYLSFLDQVLVMTVEPGFYGSPFLPEQLEKVKELRKYDPNIPIQVDGGMTPKTIGKAKKAGATHFLVGSYIMDAEDPKKAIEALEKELKKK